MISGAFAAEIGASLLAPAGGLRPYKPAVGVHNVLRRAPAAELEHRRVPATRLIARSHPETVATNSASKTVIGAWIEAKSKWTQARLPVWGVGSARLDARRNREA